MEALPNSNRQKGVDDTIQTKPNSEDIEDFNGKIEETEPKFRARTAKILALSLIIGYLILIGLSFVYLFIIVLISGANPVILEVVFAQVIDLIKTLTSAFGGLIGAVITYYFTTQR